MESLLDHVLAHADLVGRFASRRSVDVPQDEHRPQAGRKGRNGAAELGERLAPDDRRLGVGRGPQLSRTVARWVGRGPGHSEPYLAGARSACEGEPTALSHRRGVEGDPVQPRSERCITAKLAGGLAGPNPRLLEEVLRLEPVAAKPHEDAQHAAGVQLDHLAACVGVAGAEPIGKRIRSWRADCTRCRGGWSRQTCDWCGLHERIVRSRTDFGPDGLSRSGLDRIYSGGLSFILGTLAHATGATRLAAYPSIQIIQPEVTSDVFSFLRRQTPEITVDELDQLLHDGQPHVLDVREDWEFRRGHVPRALHIPLGQLGQRFAELPPGERVVVICQSGNRSLAATDFLLAQGFEGSASVKGGTSAWARSGRPLEDGPARAA